MAKKPYIWDGSNWVELSIGMPQLAYSSASPTGPYVGQIWIDTSSTSSALDPLEFLSIASASATYISDSIVDAKGDLIVATAADTVDKLTVGANGQMLMADSSATAGLRYVDPPANRNLIINGAMQVAQRSTSVTGITTQNYRTADRWYLQVSNLGTWTNSIEDDGPSGSGLSKSLKMLCTTADANPGAGTTRVNIQQRLEGQDLQRLLKGTASALQLTASFWVKSNVTGTYIVRLDDTDNSRAISASYSVNASGTWEKKTVTFPADTSGALDNDNDRSFTIYFDLAVGTVYNSGTLQTTWASDTAANRAVGQTNLAAAQDNYWQITGVQLETGPVATPFEFEPYEATLRKCQRYYYKQTAPAAGSKAGAGYVNATTSLLCLVCFPVPMRTRPTALEQSGTAADYGVLHSGSTTTACNSVPTFGNANVDNSDVSFPVASGLTAGHGALGRYATTNGFLAWSAEL